MVATIGTLITKQDNFEIIRDQIGAILFDNQAAQVALAVAEPDPDLWKLRVFIEATNPLEQFLNAAADDIPDTSPIVNVWYESGTFDPSKGDTVNRTHHAATYNVDVYAWGIAEGGAAPSTHTPGDVAAALTCQRGVRFVRNFLMASENKNLQLPTLVWKRSIQSITLLPPELEEFPALQIHAARVAFLAEFNEFSPQGDESNLIEQISVDINVGQNGMIFPAGAEFDYT